MTDNRMKRERTDRGTTFTLSGGTKISFSDVCKSELHEALEKLYILEQSIDDMVPVVNGRWSKFYKSGNKVEEGFVSSCCDMWNERKSSYCPGCGARMDGE